MSKVVAVEVVLSEAAKLAMASRNTLAGASSSINRGTTSVEMGLATYPHQFEVAV
jgi:hypothetical protein